MSATIFSSTINTENSDKNITEPEETDNTNLKHPTSQNCIEGLQEQTSSKEMASQTYTPQKTRIPIPSPMPLRRSYSLQVKGDKKSPEYCEKYKCFDDSVDAKNVFDKNTTTTSIARSSRRSTLGQPTKYFPPSAVQLLQRGQSFNNCDPSTSYDKDVGCTSGGAQAVTPRRSRDYVQWRVEGSRTKAAPLATVETASTVGRRNDSFAKSKVFSRSMSLPTTNTPGTSRPPLPSIVAPSAHSPCSPGSVSSPRTPSFGDYHSHNNNRHLTVGHRSGSCSLNMTTVGGDSWETDSMISGVSGVSLASTRGGECDHASVARNGTTFSGRSMKYVFHCNQHAGQTGEDYLTPTQRAHRQVRKLKALLREAQSNLEQKDSDIVKLTKEVVELRLYKAALGSPEDKSNSSDVDVVTVRENDDVDGFEGNSNAVAVRLVNGETSPPNAKYNEMNSSYTDSGHYDDYTCSSVHSKDSVLIGDECSPSPVKQRNHYLVLVDRATSVDNKFTPITDLEVAHKELVAEYERRLNEMLRSHDDEQQDLKRKHTEKVDELLQRITEINARYWELVPELDSAKERIQELEQQLDEAIKKLEEQEEKHKQSFLEMYHQGQETQRLQHDNQLMDMSQRSSSRISVSELLHQLQITQTELENLKDVEYTSKQKQPLLSAKEAVSLWVLGARKAMYRQLTEARAAKNKIDPEITLQFLKSAIYYFLTDKENNQGHLRAIQSILGFTPSEIQAIEKARQA